MEIKKKTYFQYQNDHEFPSKKLPLQHKVNDDE